MDLAIGKTYDITHTRKGSFVFRAESEDSEWVSGTVMGGKAKAMNKYNECEKGEELTMRKSFITRAVEV